MVHHFLLFWISFLFRVAVSLKSCSWQLPRECVQLRRAPCCRCADIFREKSLNHAFHYSALRSTSMEQPESENSREMNQNWGKRFAKAFLLVWFKLLILLGFRKSDESKKKEISPWAGLFRSASDSRSNTSARGFLPRMLSKKGTWLGLAVIIFQGKSKEMLSDIVINTKGELLFNLSGRPHYTRQVPVPAPLLEHLIQNKVTFGAAKAYPGGFIITLIQLFPVLWLALIFFLLRRNIGESVGTAGKRVTGDTLDRSLSFDDIAGIDEAKTEVRELVTILRDPAPYVAAGARLPSGVMLVGPPGTGKTLLARVMAAEAGVPYFYCSGSDFVEMFVGRGAARVRKLFAKASSVAPCILFFDELDALGKQRSTGPSRGYNDEAEQTLNQLLACMDGLDTNNNGVIVVGATNRFDMLDDALTRPGRFDRIVKVGVPDESGRLAILKVHTRNMQLLDPSILSIVASATPGLSGAELASIANEAAIRAARRSSVQVSAEDFQGAVKIFYSSRSKTPTSLQSLMKGLLQ